MFFFRPWLAQTAILLCASLDTTELDYSVHMFSIHSLYTALLLGPSQAVNTYATEKIPNEEQSAVAMQSHSLFIEIRAALQTVIRISERLCWCIRITGKRRFGGHHDSALWLKHSICTGEDQDPDRTAPSSLRKKDGAPRHSTGFACAFPLLNYQCCQHL